MTATPTPGRERAGTVRRTRTTGPAEGPSDLVVGTAAALVLFALLVVRNRWILEGPVLVGGDVAHQFATAWDALSLRELRGNGSRTGFNHPGPSYLWIWGAVDAVRKVLGSPVEQHPAMLLGSMAFTSAQLGAVVAILRSHLRSVPRAALVVSAVVLSAGLVPFIVAGSWLPEMFLATFTLLLVAGASVAAGRLPSLVAFVVALGFLVQGHVVFVSFAAVGCVAVAVTTWRTGDLRRLVEQERPTLVASGALAAAFTLPVLTYTLLDWPGELGEYLEWSRRPESGGHSLTEAARFVLHFWPGGSARAQLAVAAASFAALAGAAWWRRSRLGWCVLGAAVLAELCLANYVLTGLDDVAAYYVAIWMVGVPGLVGGLALALALGDRVVAPDSTAGRVAVAAVTSVVVVAVVLTAPSTLHEVRDSPARFEQVYGLVDRIQSEIGSRTLVLDVSSETLPTYWFTPALVSVALDRGIDLCLVESSWSVKYTPERICDEDDLRDGAPYAIYPSTEPLPPGVSAEALQPYYSVFIGPGRRRPA